MLEGSANPKLALPPARPGLNQYTVPPDSRKKKTDPVISGGSKWTVSLPLAASCDESSSTWGEASDTAESSAHDDNNRLAINPTEKDERNQRITTSLPSILSPPQCL